MVFKKTHRKIQKPIEKFRIYLCVNVTDRINNFLVGLLMTHMKIMHCYVGLSIFLSVVKIIHREINQNRVPYIQWRVDLLSLCSGLQGADGQLPRYDKMSWDTYRWLPTPPYIVYGVGLHIESRSVFIRVSQFVTRESAKQNWFQEHLHHIPYPLSLKIQNKGLRKPVEGLCAPTD